MESVVILCKTLLKGGAEKQALTLAKLLTDEHIDVRVINWSGNQIDIGNEDYLKKNSLKYTGLEGNPLKKFLAFQKIIATEKRKVVLSYLTLPNFISGITRLLNNKIAAIGGIRTEKLPFYKFFFERIVHNHLNDATVFNNFSAKNKFEQKGFNASKIYVIHNTINVPELKENIQSDTEVRVISVSRFVESKDLNTALLAFSNLVHKNKGKRFRYLIAGYGKLEDDIRAKIKELNISDEVQIMINPSDIPGILKECDIFLSTSLFEGLSNSIMEAMVAGLPVIATDVGDNRYLIRNNYNGFIVGCRDINSVTEKLEYLSVNVNLRREFGRNSYALIKDEFSEKKLTDNYIKLLSHILNN